MKSKINPFLAFFILTSSVHAAPKIWDVVAGDGAAITAGSGAWLTGGPNWNTGVVDSTWIAGNDKLPTTLGLIVVPRLPPLARPPSILPDSIKPWSLSVARWEPSRPPLKTPAAPSPS